MIRYLMHRACGHDCHRRSRAMYWRYHCITCNDACWGPPRHRLAWLAGAWPKRRGV